MIYNLWFSHFLCHYNRLFQRSQFIVDFLQLVFFVALGYDAAACLEPKHSVAADESTDGDGLIQRTVQTDEADATAVGATVVWFQFADELHDTNFWGAAQSACGEGVDKSFDGFGIIVQCAADTADKVDNVAVILHLLVEIHFYIVAVARKVVAGEVDEHDVFSVFFGVVVQVLGISGILLWISGTLGGAGNGVDVGMTAFDAAVGFRRRTEDAETAEVEVKQVRRWVDAAQGAIEFEVVTHEALFEAAGEDNLENVSTQTVGNALTDICLVLFVGQRGGGFADGTEVVGGIVAVVDGFLYGVQFALFTGGKHFEKHHFVFEIVEDDKVLIENVEHIRCIIGGFAAVLHRDVFEIAHGIERGVAIKTAIVGVFTFDVEAAEEIFQSILYAVFVCDGMFFASAVGQTEDGRSVVDADACQRTKADEGTVVFTAVIVRTLHEGALREHVTDFKIGTYGSVKIPENGTAVGLVVVCIHNALIIN